MRVTISAAELFVQAAAPEALVAGPISGELATEAVDAQQDDARKYLAGLSQKMQAEGVRHELLIGQGRPADVLDRAINDHRIDLIAMATHGRHGLSRLLSGSVTESVLREVHIPLLVLPVKHE